MGKQKYHPSFSHLLGLGSHLQPELPVQTPGREDGECEYKHGL